MEEEQKEQEAICKIKFKGEALDDFEVISGNEKVCREFFKKIKQEEENE